MRKTLTYLAFAALLLSCAGKEDIPNGQVGGKPIFFVQEVATRGTLLADRGNTPALADSTFKILGFKYDGEWSTVKVQSSYSNNGVFDNFKQDVISDDQGNCTYEETKTWEDKNYSFFAYFPDTLRLTTKSKAEYTVASEDAPYVYYELPKSTYNGTEEIGGVTYTKFIIDPEKTPDIVTASVLNTNSLYNYHVPLTFYHRLFCINVKIQNLEKYPLKITEMEVKLTGLKYGKAWFPLDDQNNSVITEDYNPGATNPMCIFEILRDDSSDENPDDQTIPELPDGSTTMNEVVIDGPDHDRNILLIPQEQSLTFRGAITLTYDKGTGALESSGELQIVGVEELTYRAGRKYTISIIYSESSITVTMDDAGEWTDSIQNIIFE